MWKENSYNFLYVPLMSGDGIREVNEHVNVKEKLNGATCGENEAKISNEWINNKKVNEVK